MGRQVDPSCPRLIFSRQIVHVWGWLSDFLLGAIPQTGCIPHGMRRSIPRLVNGVHITDPNVDEVVKSGVVQGHVIRPTIQLVLVESHQAPVIDEVVHRQPLFKDVAEVLLRVFRPKESGIDNL